MNNKATSEPESHKTLKILNELSDNDSPTQRDLSSKLGIALGLVNSYIKNLIAKGYITVKSIPPRRYAYYLTPKGFAEKTRLTIHLLQDYSRIYREARITLKKLFSELQTSGVKKVVFAGVDEVAEIAYISLQETEIELSGVLDDEKAGKKFFGIDIKPIKDINPLIHNNIVITSFVKREKIYKELREYKVSKEAIKTIFD